jgi:hypothetical protein
VHSRAVRDISFSPTDAKFVTCSDDSGVKVFDFDKVRSRDLGGNVGSDALLQAGTSIMDKQKTVACERLFDGHNVRLLFIMPSEILAFVRICGAFSGCDLQLA